MRIKIKSLTIIITILSHWDLTHNLQTDQQRQSWGGTKKKALEKTRGEKKKINKNNKKREKEEKQ